MPKIAPKKAAAGGLLAVALAIFLLAFLTRRKPGKAVHGDVTEGDGFEVTSLDPSSVNSQQEGS